MIGVFVLTHLLATVASLSGWLPDALANEALRGSREALRLVASLPGSAVPEAACAASERFDWAVLKRQATNYATQVQRVILRGRESGLDLWPPLAPA